MCVVVFVFSFGILQSLCAWIFWSLKFLLFSALIEKKCENGRTFCLHDDMDDM